MNIAELRPTPEFVEPFRLDRVKFVPTRSGCYALATAADHVLYAGLASNLRSRMVQHLDDAAKVSPTAEGRAVCFHWLECIEINSVERGWLNMHRVQHGRLPILNTLDSPVTY